MREISGFSLPAASDVDLEDSLFHYTTATGLLGILNSGSLWTTAYYCANDESEMESADRILTSFFREHASSLIEKEDPRIEVFQNRGVGIRNHTEKFERTVTNWALHAACVYIACFYRASEKQDFYHGLLSQWRSYGTDGGYALQFSRKKLQATIKENNPYYDLQDVYYQKDNPLKTALEEHKSSYIAAFEDQLEFLAGPLLSGAKYPNPVHKLLNGPLEAYFEYLIHTKKAHFREERECRLTWLETVSPNDSSVEIKYYNRNGLIVPYIETPADLDILECVDWIIVGPGPRMADRFSSVTQLVRRLDLSIKVRPSEIPLSRH